MRSALRPTGSPNGTPTTGGCSMRLDYRRTRRSRASCTLGGRLSRRRIGPARLFLTSGGGSVVPLNQKNRARPASRSVQGDRCSTSDRLDPLDERERCDQSRPLLLLQRRTQPTADGNVRQRGPEGLNRFRGGDEGIRL